MVPLPWPGEPHGHRGALMPEDTRTRRSCRSRVAITQPVPWGRSLAEYRAMFALGGPEDGASVLDVAAGPASPAAS